MSRWIALLDKQGIVRVPVHSEGGTYASGGTDQAELNITYNYSKFYYQTIDHRQGLHWLHAKQAADTIQQLKSAIAILGTTRDPDYWKPSPGNAGYALSILLSWAEQHPEATWEDRP